MELRGAKKRRYLTTTVKFDRLWEMYCNAGMKTIARRNVQAERTSGPNPQFGVSNRDN